MNDLMIQIKSYKNKINPSNWKERDSKSSELNEYLTNFRVSTKPKAFYLTIIIK